MWLGLGLHRRETRGHSADTNESPAVAHGSWGTLHAAQPTASPSSKSSESAESKSQPVAQSSAGEKIVAPATLAMNAGPLNEDPSRSKALSSLFNSSTINCDVSAGQGAYWSGVGPQVHSISYQGGPFAFQAIDLQDQTATMVGDFGFTQGDLGVRVTATDDGLFFAGFNRAGDLIIVTVYSALDGAGHYRMVMSEHARQFNNESAQFYGACDTTLAQLPSAGSE